MPESSDNDWTKLFDQLPIDFNPSVQKREEVKEQIFSAFESQAARRTLGRTLQVIGHTLMKYRIPHGIAATLCIALVIWLLQSTDKTAVALDVLIEKFLHVKTVRFDSITTTEVGSPLTSPMKFKGFYSEPGHLRVENERFINITDFATGKSLILDRVSKQAGMLSFDPKSLDDEIPENISNGNWIVAMRQFLKQASTDPNAKIRSLGPDRLDNRDVVGCRSELANKAVTLWIDPTTQMPVRIVVTGMGPPRYEIVYSNFEFNVELDNSIFQLEVPEGYTLSDARLYASPSMVMPRSESDLVRMLEMYSQKFGGKIKFDPLFVEDYLRAQISQNNKAGSDPSKDWVESVRTFRRGLQFAYALPSESDAHYAGIEAKYGEGDRAVFWYKPAGSDTYRVIYADLSVRDLAEAPKTQEAIRLPRP